MNSLADLLTGAELNHPAVILPDANRASTYRALGEQIEELAAVLAVSGLQPGTPVAIVLPNGLEYLAVFLATTRARLIAAPLNPAYKVEEFRFYLEDIGARAIIAPPGPHPVREADVLLEVRPARLVDRDRGSDGWGVERRDGEHEPAERQPEGRHGMTFRWM